MSTRQPYCSLRENERDKVHMKNKTVPSTTTGIADDARIPSSKGMIIGSEEI